MKRSGQRWSDKGAQNMLNLRMAYKSGKAHLSTIKEDLRDAKKGVSCLNASTSLNAAFTNHPLHPLIRGRPSSLDGDVPDDSFTAHANTGTVDAIINR
jgi:hypothetical protein